MNYPRRLNLLNLLEDKSHFLFGARGTGKSTLIRNQVPDAEVYDLLKNDVFTRLLRSPHILREELQHRSGKIVVIDEIQKLPQLLDEVHWLIENRNLKFLLTGSSARKLKRGGANLLASRAWIARLLPLTSQEISDFNLIRYLNRGGLPHIYQSPNSAKELRNYIDTYIREEVLAEALTRSIQNFTEFLDLIALSNGQEINYESLGRDCGVSPLTIKSYIQILEDTLIAFTLPAYRGTRMRKAISRSKFYFFDVGVANALAKAGEIKDKSISFGHAFEHFIIGELRAWNFYEERNKELYYWRSTSRFEVDLLIGSEIAIEIKGTDKPQDKHLKSLRALAEEKIFKRLILVCCAPKKRSTKDGIEIYPYSRFLEELWANKI